MNRLIAYMGSDPERLAAALAEHHDLLPLGQVPPDSAYAMSCGLGFYHGGEVLLQRRPRVAANGLDWAEIGRSLRTAMLIVQAKSQPLRIARNENTAPYRFRNWLMGHCGALGLSTPVRDELIASVPEHMRRNIRGQDESEVLFHLFLAALAERGNNRLDDINLDPEVAVAAMSGAIGRLRERMAGKAGALGGQRVVLANGRILIGLRLGEEPLWMRHVQSITDQGKLYEHFHAVLLYAGSPSKALEAADFKEVPPDHAVMVNRDLSIRTVPLAPPQQS